MTARAKLYHFSGRALARSGCEVMTSTGHTLRTGLPVKAGGDDSAPQPVECMVAALLGCETATAHFVARHLWPRPHNRIESISFEDIVAERDERGALSLPITEPGPVTAGLIRVDGTARVSPAKGSACTLADVQMLGRIVELRCPVAAMLRASGCTLNVAWTLVQ